MRKVEKIYRFAKKKYDLLVLKKYTTVAGTLVFFLIMSIMPFAFLLTLLIGKLPIDMERVLALSVFDSVKEVLLYVKREAEAATASISVILLLTTVYSSSTLFYQMRKSGEIIYDYRRKKRNWKIRIGAFLLLTIVMAMFLAFFIVLAFGGFLLAGILPEIIEKTLDYLLLIAWAFLLVLLLNMYICPYKRKMQDFIFGTMITVILWAVAIFGFSVYVQIGNMGKLYGALSIIIVFLLWLYVLMIGFIIGVIINSEKIAKAYKQERKRKEKV